MKLFTRLAPVVLSSSILCQPLLAQNTSEPSEEDPIRWYQIELIAFSQSIPSQGQEKWRPDIALAYPPNWKQLKTPQKFKAPENVDSENSPGETVIKSADTPKNSSIATDLTVEPYYLLPREDNELNPNARALKRDKRYRVLFHQSWRQPVVDIDNAPSLLISGGDSFSNHHELEGSITISVARYLHLHTNLWFSEFTRNYGQEQGQWPALPIRPDLRQVESQEWSTSLEGNDAWSNFNGPESEFEKILNQPYVLDRVVLVKQKRRMRSGELHFIDHPLLGLLIKVTPYELPVEDAPQETELNDTTGL
jgi:Peptidoglycan-binding protein, CsiV